MNEFKQHRFDKKTEQKLACKELLKKFYQLFNDTMNNK
jgi:hypothetical protein